MTAPSGGTIARADLQTELGREIGVSPWIVVDQSRIDAFADATEDHQFIHVDPVRAAAETPFGGTIAHGFLSLSLLSSMGYSALPAIEGVAMSLNYGFDRVRFLTPVRARSEVRGRFRLTGIEDKGPGRLMLRYEATVDIKGQDKPALIADWLAMLVFSEPLTPD